MNAKMPTGTMVNKADKSSLVIAAACCDVGNINATGDSTRFCVRARATRAAFRWAKVDGIDIVTFFQRGTSRREGREKKAKLEASGAISFGTSSRHDAA